MHSGKFNQQIYILDYLRTHTLIDDLLIRILKSRVNFLFDNRVVCHDPLVVLKALANEFSLRSEHEEGVYTFYEK